MNPIQKREELPFKKNIRDTGDSSAGDLRGRRDQLMEAATTLSTDIGIKPACESLDIPRSGFYRM